MKRVIIDTDAGVDDALAIILALKSPELSVEAITTVAGNAEVEKCTRNCLLLLDLLQLKRSPLVAQGAAKPLVNELVTAPEVHGDDGLGNVAATYPPPRHKAVKVHAVDVMLDFVRQFPGQLTIVALGPMTNLALALEKDPRTMQSVRRIISMGGAFRVPGNTGPVAEFNMYVDPHAAARVIRANLPLTFIPLDVTQQVRLTGSRVARLRAKGERKVGTFIAKCTQFYMEYHKKTEGFFGGYLHDPLAVGVAIRPRFLRCRRQHVEVETDGTLTRGMTVMETGPSRERQSPNATVAYAARKKEFEEFFYRRVWS
jgi:inosine-uridine nucleoside N-ribohydrolase